MGITWKNFSIFFFISPIFYIHTIYLIEWLNYLINLILFIKCLRTSMNIAEADRSINWRSCISYLKGGWGIRGEKIPNPVKFVSMVRATLWGRLLSSPRGKCASSWRMSGGGWIYNFYNSVSGSNLEFWKTGAKDIGASKKKKQFFLW